MLYNSADEEREFSIVYLHPALASAAEDKARLSQQARFCLELISWIVKSAGSTRRSG
jgi:hypothetical protein